MRTAIAFAALIGTAAADPPPVCPPTALAEGGGKMVGAKSAEPGEAPWQVSVSYAAQLAPQLVGNAEWQFRHFCGGSLIAPHWVLTAGHCVVIEKRTIARNDELKVRLGGQDLSTGMVDHAVDRVIIHNQFSRDATGTHFDIALLHLVKPAVLAENKAALIAIAGWEGAPPPPELVRVQLSGWGNTAEGGQDTPQRLRTASVSTIRHADCEGKFAPNITIGPDAICAFEKGKDSCQGDSGGPMAWQDKDRKWWLVGVVSGGIGCGRDYPGIYSNVAYFADWIREKTGGLK